MKMTKEQHVDSLLECAKWSRKNADDYEAAAKWIEAHFDKIEGLDINHCGSFLQIQTPTRQDLMRVLKAFPGKWDKSVGEKDATLDYTLHRDGEPDIYCKSAPPPPSCQIVEEVVDIPAQPARRELRKVVKCVPDVVQAPDELTEMVAI